MRLVTDAIRHIGNELVRQLFVRDEKVHALNLLNEDQGTLRYRGVEVVKGQEFHTIRQVNHESVTDSYNRPIESKQPKFSKIAFR